MEKGEGEGKELEVGAESLQLGQVEEVEQVDSVEVEMEVEPQGKEGQTGESDSEAASMETMESEGKKEVEVEPLKRGLDEEDRDLEGAIGGRKWKIGRKKQWDWLEFLSDSEEEGNSPVYGERSEVDRQDLPLKVDFNEMRVLGVKFNAEGLGGRNWEDIFKKIQRKGREPTCPVRGLALGQARKIWKEVAHLDLLNRHRDLAWQVAHGVLPVRAVMHRRGMSRIAVCPRDGCGCEESVRHLLWDCEAAQALWKEVCPLLQHLHPGIMLDCQLVLYGTKGKIKAKIKANAWTQAWQVVNCTKEALWKARCLLVLEDKLLKKEQMKRVAWAAVKDYMFRDSRRKGQEVARRTWGHAAWTMVMGRGGLACSGPGLPL
ncbi:uncharacterized protein LOC118219190 [Anguilla anguilla]|uniref:uncharacterized protein LOC118219190 n=1 Tax=Anguilla anguilla TaxID=7936 RepID=UPI0015AF3929|nr:uncharacterized protein LOC118219190 [Anguilla anguilla]